MKHTKKSLALLLCVSASLLADSCSTSVAPYFSIRSQSVNLPRTMVGQVDHVNRFDMEKFYGSFAVVPGYSQSFRDEAIARCLFGNSLNCANDCAQITISGRDASNRGSCDWLADYFGLPRDFKSTVTFKPKIKTFTMDFSLYVGLDEWVSGLWFKAWAPFVHTRWDLNACESVSAEGTAVHTAGYFSSAQVTRSNLLSNAMDFFRNGKVPTINNGNEGTITFEKLRSCKWGDCGCDGDLTENGLADLRFGLGWNFFQDEDYHIGLGIMAAAPTGNRPEGCYLFEPMVGNGNHWEVGAMWTSHVIFWRSEDDEKHFGGYLDANITHLFKTRQKRCFDLCGKPMSRYMLAEGLTSTVSDLYASSAQGDGAVGTAPSHQFANKYAPVGNLTCSDVDVSVGVQADVVAMLNYTSGGFSFDLGYNLWARSCEKIEFDCDCLPRIAKSTELWALKGDARVYGFVQNNTTAIKLSGSNSNATIFKGSNAGLTTGSDRNFGVDNPLFAQNAATASMFTNQINRDASYNTGGSAIQMQTSKDPVLLSKDNINLQGARTKGLSHSVFAHFNYSWLNNEDWTPFLGIGMQAEFSNNSGDCKTSCSTSTSTSSTSCSTSCDSSSTSCCDDCHRCSVSQWSVFVKGGISFN